MVQSQKTHHFVEALMKANPVSWLGKLSWPIPAGGYKQSNCLYILSSEVTTPLTHITTNLYKLRPLPVSFHKYFGRLEVSGITSYAS
jgi:hypothetical protein